MARAVAALRLSRYGGFLEALLTGNLRSLHSRRPVSSLLVERAPMTLLLGLSALLLGLLIAIPAGVLAARRPHSWMDLTATLGTMVVMSMPTFWLGPLLLRLFSVDLNWFPVSGADGWRSLILPASTLGLGLSALLTRQIRAGMLEVLSADHIRAARARGLPETRVLFRHALRCAALPLVTLVGLQFGAVLSGSIIIEEIFGWPGLGRELVDAIRGRDFPLIQGCVFLMSASYALGSLLAELLSSVLNPLLREDR
jgi:peptide/nickel transport system permease protein